MARRRSTAATVAAICPRRTLRQQKKGSGTEAPRGALGLVDKYRCLCRYRVDCVASEKLLGSSELCRFALAGIAVCRSARADTLFSGRKKSNFWDGFEKFAWGSVE